MSAHTPGPWRWISKDALWAETGPYDYTVIECGDDGKPYGMHSALIVHNADDAMAEANRRLIAAAPELLAAARLALSEAESWIHDQLDGTSSLEGALQKLAPVRAAIARATGESL